MIQCLIHPVVSIVPILVALIHVAIIFHSTLGKVSIVQIYLKGLLLYAGSISSG